jgi:hypothetical protein
MRAYRLCAAFSRASSRPRNRLRVSFMLLALVAGLCVPSADSRAAEPVPAASANRPGAASQSYCGIFGEVSRPGVYELTADTTFGQLLRSAGGITPDANGNARVFRGARVAQQLFVVSSDSASLYPGDLILVEGSGRRQSATKLPTVAPAPRATEVQLGFLNLLDRPVVVRMPRDLASPARIVELLGQSPALVEGIRVVGPAGRDERRAPESNSDTGLLQSGTVLIFPAHCVRAASLPSLPEPIAQSPEPPKFSLTVDPQTSSTESPQRAQAQNAASAAAGANCQTESNRPAVAGTPPQEQIGRLIHAGPSARSLTRMSRSPFRNVAPDEWEWAQRQTAERIRDRPYFSFFVLAGVAVSAMLLTIGSMVLRWINGVRSQQRNQTAGILAPAPTLFAPEAANRPIRVDANLPQTRLGIDLAVFERARARHHIQGPVANPDPAPRAA